MKKLFFLLDAGLVLLLAGCSSTPPTTLAPVGPNPASHESVASMGVLQIFSKEVKRRDDREQGGDGAPGWYQHADYTIYNTAGKPVRHVENEAGHYAQAPEQVTLPPGKYLVKTEDPDYFWVRVPVTIKRGRTTTVHLDDQWKPPADARKRDLVTMPDGKPVGWVSIDKM